MLFEHMTVVKVVKQTTINVQATYEWIGLD